MDEKIKQRLKNARGIFTDIYAVAGPKLPELAAELAAVAVLSEAGEKELRDTVTAALADVQALQRALLNAGVATVIKPWVVARPDDE